VTSCVSLFGGSEADGTRGVVPSNSVLWNHSAAFIFSVSPRHILPNLFMGGAMPKTAAQRIAGRPFGSSVLS
jgi:hypothetical protein